MASTVNIGVMFRREQAPEALPVYAKRVEALGFDELWVVEDCFYHGGIAQAAVALAATETVTVGLGIAPAVARNAAFLAMEFATLARMFPGRLHGGIGHGVAEWMDQIGETPASWLAALEETTDAVRRIVRGENVTMDGKHLHLRDIELHHDIDQENVPPILLGVRGPKSLRLSGRCADGTLLAENSAPAYVSAARADIAKGQDDAGRAEHHRVSVYANCVVSADDPDAARLAIRRATADTLGGEGNVQLKPLSYAGEIDALARKGGAEALFDEMPEAWLDDLAITGSPEDGAASIQRLVDAGTDAVILVPPVGTDYDAWLETVGEELLPLLR